MDCEKFEASMLGELYGELDELTLAASKRHVGGCARCSALMAGLRATRKVVTLPVLAPSEGFESRLLSAVHLAEEQTRPKFSFAQVISLAGAWAMRPQTAMAAVFLLIVGTSSVLLSRRAPRSAMTAESSFTVTENGSPAAAAPMASAMAAPQELALDPRAAAAAHGAAMPAASAAAAPAPTNALAAKSLPSESAPSDSTLDQASTGGFAKYPAKPRAASPARMAPNGSMFDDTPGSLGALGHGGPSGVGDLKGSPEAQFAPPPPASTPAAPTKKDEDSPSATAMQQYRRGDYEEARDSFHRLAAGGDSSAALMEARSVRDGSGGCTSAVASFDATSGAPGNVGYDATLEAANCYRSMGQVEAARSRYARLLTVPAYATRAQAAINAMSLVASSKPRSMSKAAAAPAAPPAATPPPSAPATPAAAPAGK